MSGAVTSCAICVSFRCVMFGVCGGGLHGVVGVVAPCALAGVEVLVGGDALLDLSVLASGRPAFGEFELGAVGGCAGGGGVGVPVGAGVVGFGELGCALVE